MLPDKQANMKNKLAECSPLKSPPTYLKRSTCSPDQSEDCAERSTSQNVNLLLQRGLHVQTHSLAQGEIPASLKRIAFRGNDDCLCHWGLLWLYYTVSSVECLYLFSQTWPAYISSYHQETRSNGQMSCCIELFVCWSETRAHSSD